MRRAGKVVEGWSCADKEAADVPTAAKVRATRRAPIVNVEILSILWDTQSARGVWKSGQYLERRQEGITRVHRMICGDVVLVFSMSLPGSLTLRKRQVTRRSEITSTADWMP